MKICLIEDFYRPYSSGGASAYIIRLSDALVTAGHQVVIVTTAPPHTSRTVTEHQGPIKVIRIPTHLQNIPVYTHKIAWLGKIPSVLLYWFNPWVYGQVTQALQAERPDVVHTVDTLYLSLSALVAARRSRIPWAHSLLYVNLLKPTGLVWRDGKKAGLGWWKIFLPVTRWLVRSPQLIIAPSQYALGIHQDHGFFRNSKTAVVYLGPMHVMTATQRHHQRPVNFLTVGRMNREKGTAIVVQAFQHFTNPTIRLTVVGAGPDEEKIRELARTDDRITIKNHLSSEDLSALYSQSDVYISASLADETFNMTICEAFHAGLPAIVSAVGAQPELVGSESGLVVPPGDVAALSQAIQRYVEQPDLWVAQARQAQIHSKKFFFEDNVNTTIALYKELCDSVKA